LWEALWFLNPAQELFPRREDLTSEGVVAVSVIVIAILGPIAVPITVAVVSAPVIAIAHRPLIAPTILVPVVLASHIALFGVSAVVASLIAAFRKHRCRLYASQHRKEYCTGKSDLFQHGLHPLIPKLAVGQSLLAWTRGAGLATVRNCIQRIKDHSYGSPTVGLLHTQFSPARLFRVLLRPSKWGIFRRFSANQRGGTVLKRLVVALVLATSVFALSAMADEMKGYISDSKCGAKHAKDMNAKCVEGCVKGGASPVFVTGGKVYKVDDASKVAEHLGHEVTITGSIDGDTVKVESVKM
jgi:hypothetical protein